MDEINSYKEGIYKIASEKAKSKIDPYRTTKTVAANNIFDNALDTVVDVGTMTGGILLGAGALKEKGLRNKIKATKLALTSSSGRRAFKSFGNQQILAIPIGLGITGAYTGLSYLRDKKYAEKIQRKKNGIYKKASEDFSAAMPIAPTDIAIKAYTGKALFDRLAERRARDSEGKDIFDRVLEQKDFGRY
jgi:hypothetical protein